MANPKYTRNKYLQATSIPTDNIGATFNDGAFVVGFTATLATITSTDIGLTTADSQVVFSGFQISTDSGDLTIDIYGESTFTSGTALTPFNTNKNSLKVPSVDAIVQDPTVSVLGDVQFPPFTIKGDNNQNVTESLLFTTPIILAPSTSYIFRLTHNETGTRDVSGLLTAFDNIIDEATFS
jgi:hypothetical protein